MDGPAEQPASPASPAPVTTAKPVAAPPALEYDRTPTHVTRGQFRIFLILLTINTVAVVGYLWAPNSLSWARQMWREYQTKREAAAAKQKTEAARAERISTLRKTLDALADAKPSPDTVAYTEDPVEAASLIASDPTYETIMFNNRGGSSVGTWQPAVAVARPGGLNPLADFIEPSVSNISSRQVHLLLCRRQNPAGAERLLWCELDAMQSAESTNFNEFTVVGFRVLRVRLIDTGTADRAPSRLFRTDTVIEQARDERTTVKGGKENTPQVFRFASGVPDPKDPTRATIPYRLNGVDGTFVVRVVEGDRLSVEPSAGRIAERGGDRDVSQRWLPSAQPAVRVTPVEGTKR